MSVSVYVCVHYICVSRCARVYHMVCVLVYVHVVCVHVWAWMMYRYGVFVCICKQFCVY